MKDTEIIQLPASSPCCQYSLHVMRFGKKGTGRKVYIQAGLHADEAPGYLVAHHLIKLLNVSQINGEIIVVPIANPIGLNQWQDDNLYGRFHFASSINFNRLHLDVCESVAGKIDGQLTQDEAFNTSLIRRCFGDAIEETAVSDDVEFLKKQLLQLAHDADIVLDLHCDKEALMHLYLGTPLWSSGSDLAAQLGAEVTLLAKNSGDNPFDEACSSLWWNLADRFPDYPIPAACLAATVELRGSADTTPGLAEMDALNIIRFLQRRGIIAGKAPHTPPLKREATPLTGVDYITASVPGVVIFTKELGETVAEGEKIAEIVNPLPEKDETHHHPVISRTDGILFTRNSDRLCHPGRIIAKVSGKKPMRSENGPLLTH